ncbi:MAG TPA: PQQ-binding-like beta-propeller repeat protein [Polyangiaceae bacterium]|nr:PQQ-binding-like beta-propeller repeat protein [Polyangiaceae bacterium]
MSRSSRLRWGAATCGLVASLFAPLVHSQVDTLRAQHFALATARLPQRTSPGPLPQTPRVGLRVRVAGGILHPPTVAPDDTLLLALSNPVIAAYEVQRGQLLWTARLGSSPAASSVIALRDGRRAVITENLELIVFNRLGRTLSRRTLPLSGADPRLRVSAAPDGGLWIVLGRRVLRLDAALELRFQTQIATEAAVVLPDQSPPLLVAATGEVYAVATSGEVTRVGNFQGRVEDAVAADELHVLAVVDGKRVLELDLESGGLSPRFLEPDLDLQPRLTRNSSGLWFTTSNDLLLSLTNSGRERLRAPIPASPFTRLKTVDVLPGPDGTAFVSRSATDLLHIAADGNVSRVEGTACAEPLPPQPLPGSRVILACRSGIILRLDDAATSARAP